MKRRIISRWGMGAFLLALGRSLPRRMCDDGRETQARLGATDTGTAIYMDKYEFKRPPSGWKLLRDLEGGDFEFGFLKFEKGPFPTQSTFIYDDRSPSAVLGPGTPRQTVLYPLSVEQRGTCGYQEAGKHSALGTCGDFDLVGGRKSEQE